MMNEKGVEMLNLFKRPFHQESLDSWCKILDDIAKVAILAVPVVLYGEKPIEYRIINGISLVVCAYCFLVIANLIRTKKEKLIQPRG